MNGLFSSFFGLAAPYIQDGIASLVTLGAGWLFVMLNSKLGINISAANRASLTASAERVAGQIFTGITAGHLAIGDLFTAAAGTGTMVLNPAHPAVAAAVASVQAAAPDALKALGLSGTSGVPTILEKIAGGLGPLLAMAGGPVGIVGGVMSALAGPAATVAVTH
jgi:hypothetical protein